MPRIVSGTLYHFPASPILGDAVLPLAQVRRTYPDRASRARHTSYPDVLAQPVHPLGCTWADVVFLSPVHPAPLFAALRRGGRAVTDPEVWALPAGRLDPARTTIRLMRAGSTGHHADAADVDDYLPFTTASLRAVDRITLEAVQRLESLQPGDRWLPWVDVPHVLHRGCIPMAWFDASLPRLTSPGIVRE